MRDLIRDLFRSALGTTHNTEMGDSALLPVLDGELAMTTDSYVVRPLFFPGGDIGSLAVHGTVNDLAVSGARPLFLSAGFILEEGLPMETLWHVVQSMAAAARDADVSIVTGDTKVVENGKADGLYINTAGIGRLHCDEPPGPGRIREHDAILLSGDIGRHGIAIMAARGELGFDLELQSDSAAINHVIASLYEKRIPVHCMRDLTRGGLATALVEVAEGSGLEMNILETDIPVLGEVSTACEILGLDPLYVANEGRFVVVVPEDSADAALSILRQHGPDLQPARIGTVTGNTTGRLVLRSLLGTERVLYLHSGEQLPRIC